MQKDEQLNTVISLNDPNTYLKLGLYCYDEIAYEKSLHYLKQALKLSPDLPEVHLLLSEVHQTQNDLKQALSHIEQATIYKGKDWNLKQLFINLCLMDNQYKKASQLLSLRLHWLKGDLNFVKRFKIRLLNDLKGKSDLERALFQLAYVYREEENYPPALKYGKKLVRITKDPISHYLLATIYEAKEDFANAQKEFEKINHHVLEITPQFYEQVYMKFKENHLISHADVS